MLRRINRVVVDALEGISLEHLARPAGPLQVPKLAAESRQQGLEAQSQRVDVGS